MQLDIKILNKIIKEEIEKEFLPTNEERFSELRGWLMDQDKYNEELFNVWKPYDNKYWLDKDAKDMYDHYYYEHLEEGKKIMYSFLNDVFKKFDDLQLDDLPKNFSNGSITIEDYWGNEKKPKYKLYLKNDYAEFQYEDVSSGDYKTEKTNDLEHSGGRQYMLDLIDKKWWQVPF